MDGQAWNLKPDDIETRSLAIIDDEAGAHGWPPREWAIVRRMIHTTADFEWAKITLFHDQAIESGLKALSRDAPSSLTPRWPGWACLHGA
jgi:precorrin-8X/cobalt-precorrin-8 methylmutase